MPVIDVTTILAAPIDRIWAHANTTRLLHYVSRGRLGFDALEPPSFPDRWEERDYKVRVKALGAVPIGWQVIGIERPPAHGARLFLRDNGFGPVIKKWDHLITLDPIDERQTRYTDRLDYDAGLLSTIAKPLLRDFYTHRQKRWAKLVAANFDYDAA